MHRLALAVAVASYASAVLLANWLSTHYGMTQVGFGLTASAGTYAAGAALLSRDYVQRLGGPWFALGAVAAGCVASYLLADHFIALASAAAFLLGELLDLGVFSWALRRLTADQATFVSNVVSAPVDSVLFLWLAPAPVFMVTGDAVLGQSVGKLAWATLVPLALLMLAAQRRGRLTTAGGWAAP